MLKISKKSVTAMGNATGMKANPIAELLNLPASDQTMNIENGWQELLPVVLNPHTMAAVIALTNDEPEFFSVLTKDRSSVLCGMPDDLFTAQLFGLPEMAVDLTQRLGIVPEEVPVIRQELSADAIITFFCIADHIKRSKLEYMLNPDRKLFAVTQEMIAARFADIQAKDDIRWLSALSSKLRIGVQPDFAAGLKELIVAGLLTRDGEFLNITEESSVFFGEFTESKVVYGINSIFYTEGRLNFQPLMFIRTPLFIWYCDLSDKGIIASINQEQVLYMLLETLSSGDGVLDTSLAKTETTPLPSPVTVPIPEPVPPATEPAQQQPAPAPDSAQPAGWQCPACGQINTGMFCKKDGTPRPVENAATPSLGGKKTCKNCGNAVPAGAAFCKNCGAKQQ